MTKSKKPALPPREGTVNGVAHDFCETGTEGIIWSVQDEKHMGADGQHWSYEGLNCLHDGDYLKIFNDAARKEVAWEGEIKLKHPPATSYNRGIQSGVDEDKWAKLFYEAKPATVILADSWRKMKAAEKAKTKAKERAQKKQLQDIDKACHDGVQVTPLKTIRIKPKG